MMKVVFVKFILHQLCEGSKMGVIRSIEKFRDVFTEEVAH